MTRVRYCFGEIKEFPQISRLVRVLCSGAPVNVATGCDLQAEIAYGNHVTSVSHRGDSRQDSSERRKRAYLDD